MGLRLCVQWRLACACVAGWARGGVGTTRSDDVRIAQVADATREGGEGLTVTVTAPTYFSVRINTVVKPRG